MALTNMIERFFFSFFIMTDCISFIYHPHTMAAVWVLLIFEMQWQIKSCVTWFTFWLTKQNIIIVNAFFKPVSFFSRFFLLQGKKKYSVFCTKSEIKLIQFFFCGRLLLILIFFVSSTVYRRPTTLNGAVGMSWPQMDITEYNAVTNEEAKNIHGIIRTEKIALKPIWIYMYMYGYQLRPRSNNNNQPTKNILWKC